MAWPPVVIKHRNIWWEVPTTHPMVLLSVELKLSDTKLSTVYVSLWVWCLHTSHHWLTDWLTADGWPVPTLPAQSGRNTLTLYRSYCTQYNTLRLYYLYCTQYNTLSHIVLLILYSVEHFNNVLVRILALPCLAQQTMCQQEYLYCNHKNTFILTKRHHIVQYCRVSRPVLASPGHSPLAETS